MLRLNTPYLLAPSGAPHAAAALRGGPGSGGGGQINSPGGVTGDTPGEKPRS
jgi:hypothetical protein